MKTHVEPVAPLCCEKGRNGVTAILRRLRSFCRKSLDGSIPEHLDRIRLLLNAGVLCVSQGVDLEYRLQGFTSSFALPPLLTKGFGYVKEV